MQFLISVLEHMYTAKYSGTRMKEFPKDQKSKVIVEVPPQKATNNNNNKTTNKFHTWGRKDQNKNFKSRIQFKTAPYTLY